MLFFVFVTSFMFMSVAVLYATFNMKDNVGKEHPMAKWTTLSVFFGITVSLISGVESQRKKEPSSESKTHLMRMIVADRLPKGALNLREVGNRWMTFDMEIEGKQKHFIWNYKTDSITEISSKE